MHYGGRNLGNLFKNYKLSLDKEHGETNADLIKKRDLEEFINTTDKYIDNEENFTFANAEINTVDEIFLHALSYRWKDYFFETPDPYWADKHLPLNN